MDISQFWQIIDRSRAMAIKAKNRDPDMEFEDLQIETLTDLLSELSPEELVGFRDRFGDCMDRAYRFDLWGAAFWLFGGCSDDSFMDFRSSMICLGQKDFEQILENPDDLADIEGRPDTPFLMTQEFQYLAGQVYEEQTGKQMPEMPETESSSPSEPEGEQVDHDDFELNRRLYPKLVAKYPEMGD